MYYLNSKVKSILAAHPAERQYLSWVYSSLWHRERLYRKVNFGDSNQDKRILIIRPNTDDGVQGLMSLFIQALRWIDYAERMNYVPFVDFMNFKTQYYVENENAWTFFFKQVSSLTFPDVYSSKNVEISGVTKKIVLNESLFRENIFTDKYALNVATDLIKKYIRYSDDVNSRLIHEEKTIDTRNCIGVYVRGTDYIALKPTGEFVQPSINQVIQVIDKYLQSYQNCKLFLVTEDYRYFKILQKKYTYRLLTVSFDTFIENYDGTNFLSKTDVLNRDVKKRGQDYLIKIILLSKCRFLISSMTMGSIAAYALNGGRYQSSHIFNLGRYR